MIVFSEFVKQMSSVFVSRFFTVKTDLLSFQKSKTKNPLFRNAANLQRLECVSHTNGDRKRSRVQHTVYRQSISGEVMVINSAAFCDLILLHDLRYLK